MTALPLAMAFLVGVASATQIAMIGSLSRGRGVAEATFISLMGTVTGMALVLAMRSLRGDPPLLPPPLDRFTLHVAVAGAAMVLLVFSLRGSAPFFGMTGLLAVAFLLATAFLVPRIGVGLFFVTNAAGSLLGSILFDQVGAFGAVPMPLNPLRLAGFLVVLVGIVMVRLAR